mgnify:CR=1 FL=1
MSFPKRETGTGLKPWETSIRRARFAYRHGFSLAPTTATLPTCFISSGADAVLTAAGYG